jgi:hypothetical protein
MDEKFSVPPSFSENKTICSSCGGFMNPNETFCVRCSASFGMPQSSDPMQNLVSEGLLYGKAIQGKPKLIVVVGVWIIFLPLFLMMLTFMIGMLFFSDRGGGTAFLIYILTAVVMFFSAMMLFNVTKNYFKKAVE